MTVLLSRYTTDKKHQWNDFVRTSKNGFFMFDRDYMDYHADRFTDHSLMAYDEQGKLIAILPANEKENVLYSHQGLTFGGFITGRKMRQPVMLSVFDALNTYVEKNSINKIIYKVIPYFYHQQAAQEDLYALFRHKAKCIRVDVSSTINYNVERYAFSSSRNSGLKKARENNLTIRQSDDFTIFFQLMNDILNNKYETSATHTDQEMLLLHQRFPNNIKLYGCYHEHEMLAGIIMYETTTVAHTQYIAASIKGKELGAVDWLLKHLINEEYMNKNYFDFGISTEKAGEYLNEPLIDQKEGAGARTTVHQFYELNFGDKV